MTRPLVIFDVDGVIVDTEELNREAYKLVGVTVPYDAFGRRWEDWLPDVCGTFTIAQHVHAEKVKIYEDLLRTHGAPKLDGWITAEALTFDHYVALCSYSTEAMLEQLLYTGVLPLLHRESAAGIGKEAALKKLVKGFDRGPGFIPVGQIVYVDDNLVVGPQYAQSIGATFIPCLNNGQDLYHEIVQVTGAEANESRRRQEQDAYRIRETRTND